MIRFIDLRFQGTQHRFAFWDTVTNQFLSCGYFGAEAWGSWAEFEQEVRLPPLAEGPELDPEDAYIGRFRSLCPAWVFQPATEEELDFKEPPGAG